MLLELTIFNSFHIFNSSCNKLKFEVKFLIDYLTGNLLQYLTGYPIFATIEYPIQVVINSANML